MIRSDLEKTLLFKIEYNVNSVSNTSSNQITKKQELKNTKKDSIEISKNISFDLDRIQKIEQLKESIRNGQYSIDSKGIAYSMLENLKTLK